MTEWGHETWEPTQDTRGSSNPPEPAAQDTLQAKIAELEAALEQERRAVEVLADALVMSGSCMLGYDHTSLSDCSRSTNCRACWAAWARAETLPRP